MTRRAIVMKSDRRGNQRTAANAESKLGGEIETLILKRSSTETIVLQRLVRELSEELACRSDKIISEIIRLQADKRILIREPTPYKTLRQYLLSPISLWFWGVVLTTLVSLGLVFASSGWALYLRFVFGGLLVLLLPGYSLLGLLYFRKNDLDYLTRLALSLVLSLALATLVGFALNFTPFGITLPATALSLGALTIALQLLAAFRRFAHHRLQKLATFVG
jgi:hypothetical protein